MPPSKRKPRRSKAADLQPETSDVDMPDSSPSKPSAKKRKGNHGRATKKEVSLSPKLEPSGQDDSDQETEQASGMDLMEKVISYLTVSKEPVMVARDHTNENADANKVSAFAKIAGRDWTYYVLDMTINIGRPPDDRQALTPVPAVSSPVQDLKETFPVHIDLGPSKIVSRHHASIFYDSEWKEEGGWHIRVNGRNGVRLNNSLLRRGVRSEIKSGAIIEIAGTQMMFVTPSDKVEIDPYFVERAEAMEHGGEVEPNATASDGEGKAPAPKDLSGYQSLAPAPPNFKRMSTPPPPPSQSGRAQQGVFDSKPGTSPMYGRGMMLESTQEIDYSRDNAKDLKPPYSYAHMIAQAIFSSDDQKLTLSNIYSFIADKYAFYRHSNSGWQNSIRHNLSLNKAFQKVPRRTDEPGKGMKWMIAPEFRDEYWKKQQRRVGTSSNPSSPAAKTDVNPNFRGANGQNLGYDTSMVYQFSAKDAANPVTAPPKLSTSFPPYPAQGQNPYQTGPPPLGPSSQPAGPTSTPQRTRPGLEHHLDDSPLPAHHFPSSISRPSNANNGQPYYSLPTTNPAAQHSPTNPTLSSSYLDTPFHPSHPSSSLLTPAPLRQNPKLAPPSTLVAPSKFMPESSPVGPGGLFWKGFLGNFTPGPQSAIPPDMSPEKLDTEGRSSRRNGLEGRDIMSSSPPPMDAEMGSPTKGKSGRGRSGTLTASQLRSPDRLQEFKSNGETAGAPAGQETSRPSSSDTRPDSSAAALPPPLPSTAVKLDTIPPPLQPTSVRNQQHRSRLSTSSGSSQKTKGLFDLRSVDTRGDTRSGASGGEGTSVGPGTDIGRSRGNENDNDDEDEGGFDLVKGFAPIGSTQARSRSVRS